MHSFNCDFHLRLIKTLTSKLMQFYLFVPLNPETDAVSALYNTVPCWWQGDIIGNALMQNIWLEGWKTIGVEGWKQ